MTHLSRSGPVHGMRPRGILLETSFDVSIGFGADEAVPPALTHSPIMPGDSGLVSAYLQLGVQALVPLVLGSFKSLKVSRPCAKTWSEVLITLCRFPGGCVKLECELIDLAVDSSKHQGQAESRSRGI